MKSKTGSAPALSERIAWWAMLALPAALPVVIGSVPFAGKPPFAQGPFIYPKLAVLALLVCVSALAWALGVVGGKQPVRGIPGGWWLAGFGGLAALSTAFAMNRSMAFFGGRYQLLGLMSLLLAGGVLLLMTQLLTTPGRIRDLSWSTVAGGLVVAIVTIMQARDADPLGMARTNLYILHRGPSLLGNPDFTGTYLVVPVLVAVALALSAADVRLRAAAWVAGGVTFTAVVVSLTRGAWVGVAAGGVALVVAFARSGSARRTLVWALGGAAALLAVSVALRGGLATFAGRFSDLASTATAGDGRFVLWSDALKVIARHPLLGTGPDSYRLGWYPVRSLASVKLSGVTSVTEDPHNVVLLIAATLGVPAALFAVGLVGATLWGAARSAFGGAAATAPAAAASSGASGKSKPQRQPQPSARPAAQLLYAGWWSAFLGLCVALFFGANTITATVMLLVGAAVLLAPRVREAALPTGARTAIVAGGAALSVALLVFSAMSLAADVRLATAMAANDIAGLESAARIAPWHVQAQYQVAFTSASDALSALKAGDPQAEQAATAAEDRITRLIAANPYEYYSHSLLAFFLAQRGAIEQSADSPESTGTLKRALAAAEKAAAICPVSPEAAYLKAFSEYHLEDNAAALATLKPVWDADPKFASAGVLYVELLARTGSREQASQVLKTLQTRFPYDPAVAAVAGAVEATATPTP